MAVPVAEDEDVADVVVCCVAKSFARVGSFHEGVGDESAKYCLMTCGVTYLSSVGLNDDCHVIALMLKTPIPCRKMSDDVVVFGACSLAKSRPPIVSIWLL